MNKKLKQDIPITQMPKLEQSSIDEIKKKQKAGEKGRSCLLAARQVGFSQLEKV